MFCQTHKVNNSMWQCALCIMGRNLGKSVPTATKVVYCVKKVAEGKLKFYLTSAACYFY